jgi:hypothetical protein
MSQLLLRGGNNPYATQSLDAYTFPFDGGKQADRSSPLSAGESRVKLCALERFSLLVQSAGRGTGRDRPMGRICAGRAADESICYNSRTGHGQMFWVGITCSIGIDGRPSCCPLAAEIS